MTLRLVADVGGTNTRLALARSGIVQAGTIRPYNNADWPDLDAALANYLGAGERPDELVVAVAGPVHGAHARLTNRDWLFDAARLRDTFGIPLVRLMNDLTALGYAAKRLAPSQLTALNDDEPGSAAAPQSLVIGIGTGFNVSPVLHGHGLVCAVAEAGHVTLPHGVVQALQDLGLASYPSVEELFSGRGFSAFCQSLAGQDGRAVIAAAQVRDPDALGVVDAYSGLVGWLIRDLTLAYLSQSGVYLAGGVARAVLDIAPAPCLEVMRRPCRIRGDVVPPMWLIHDDFAALTGCASLPI